MGDQQEAHEPASELADFVDRFDREWRQRPFPPIERFLPLSGVADRRAGLLASLIEVDLEYRWRTTVTAWSRSTTWSESAAINRHGDRL